MAENVKVVVRCRPMNKRELDLRCQSILQIDNCTVSVQNPSDPSAPAKTFTFDIVYDGLATTETIYNDICYSLVENVLEGYNGTIFAYGQTGCGKTHTMQGPENVVDFNNRGIIPRSFDHIFEAISVESGVRYLAMVSYLEIYNENIRDLLNPNESATANHVLKELPGVGVVVPTLSTHTVHNAQECHQLLIAGNRNRVIGATLMNANSSRSHTIFTISLEQIKNKDGVGDGDGGVSDVADVPGRGIRRGKLNLVDLAGSERQNKTGAVGERLKEATKINLSLSALGNVISALVDGKTKHIPYRDSKLTRLLQDSLGGNTKTLMISCLSPADNNYDETISTLRYASRAKNIANKPKINEDPKDAKLREYQEEIIKLKNLLNESKSRTTTDETLNVTMMMPRNANFEWLQNEGEGKNGEDEEEQAKPKREGIIDEKPEEIQRNGKDEKKSHQIAEQQKQQFQRLHTATKSSSSAAAVVAAEKLQLEARKRIELIKQALIGGERADDQQLKERRQKKKFDAQRRLSALAQALSRVEQSEDRDLLQGHYSSIQHELNVKNEYLKAYRQKIRALEREVSDLQAEFQLDRADYLETIRRLERNLKFFQQLMDMALPILRKDGKYWNPEDILQNSKWSDDLKTWKLPESSMNCFKLPPTQSRLQQGSKNFAEMQQQQFIDNYIRLSTAASNDAFSMGGGQKENNTDDLDENEKNKLCNEVDDDDDDDNNYKTSVLNNYFRSNRSIRTSALTHQRKSFNSWRDSINKSSANHRMTPLGQNQHRLSVGNFDRYRLQPVTSETIEGGTSSWLTTNRSIHNVTDMNRTWAAVGGPFEKNSKLLTSIGDYFPRSSGEF